MISRGVPVQLNDFSNEYSTWGIYNGSRGIIQDIIYKNDKTPINGDLPDYVTIHFPEYTGPAWDPQKPKV